jgi:hypothetical protein
MLWQKMKEELLQIIYTSESYYLFHKWVKSCNSTSWFRIWQFQTHAWKLYLQMHLLAERFVFGGDERGFLKEGVKAFLTAPMSPLNSPTFFRLHICSLWIPLAQEKHVQQTRIPTRAPGPLPCHKDRNPDTKILRIPRHERLTSIFSPVCDKFAEIARRAWRSGPWANLLLTSTNE